MSIRFHGEGTRAGFYASLRGDGIASELQFNLMQAPFRIDFGNNVPVSFQGIPIVHVLVANMPDTTFSPVVSLHRDRVTVHFGKPLPIGDADNYATVQASFEYEGL